MPLDPAGHPQPQLTRPTWTDLCGPWEFAFDDDGRGLREGWQEAPEGPSPFDRTIVVPFPFESPASGVADPSFHPVVWYRRRVEVDVPPPGRQLLLHLGAVDYRAHVWVNGRLVATHEGGHTPFAADVTAALDGSGHQVIVVRAEDAPSDLRQPRGKQDWQERPHAIWYDRTSGIWQPVWLEEVAAVRVRDLRWACDVDARAVRLTARVRAEGRRDLRLRVRLEREGHVLADDTYAVVAGEVDRTLTLHDPDMSLGHSPLLWTPEQPHLIDATLTLLGGAPEAPEVLDEVGSYTALRSIGASQGRMLLNGRPYYLRLVLAQNFWPESHLAAPSADALRKEVDLAKSLGFNGVRLHQKVEDPRFLAWCDRLGLLVWAEMPAAYEFSPTTVARVTREWLEVLDRDAGHPCVVAWVPVNESWGVPALERSAEQQAFVRSLYHLTKALDPTRLVIGNDGWEQPVTDVVTVHDYTASGQVLRERYGDRARLEETLRHVQPAHRVVLLPDLLPDGERPALPVVISEFGGISLDVPGPEALEESQRPPGWGGYGWVREPGQLLDGYRDLVTALLDSPAVAGFCWTQLTDTQQERNGLLTAAREPKVPAERVRAVTTRVSAAVPGDAVGEFAYGDYAPGAPASSTGERRSGSRAQTAVPSSPE
ncbi:MAG: glycoside hydrolase family 2 TIM barrel-domain containing protein [Kineosporiaceae bacterium]